MHKKIPEILLIPSIDKLKEIREAKGITQKALAELSGVNQRTVQNFEQGKNDINQAAVIKVYALAKALDCTIEDLIEK